MTEIPDGGPVDMSKVTLGPRYGSEDMYRDYPDLRPGSRVTFEKDGVVYTDTVTSVSYSSATPEIVRQLNWWQRMLRRVTPKRWRKPLLVRAAEPATVTVGTGEGDDPLRRAQAALVGIEKALRTLE